MPRLERQAILAKLQAMKKARQPIIGGGAGTGLSAKCEEAGGIDLIVIYNSGRYRMAGRGSLAGLLAYGNANEIVRDMAREVLPVVKHTPVLAGVNGTDPFCLFDPFLDDLKRLGFSGVQNFPTVGLIDGVMRANLEETGMSYALEVEMIALARAKDMLTTPYVFSVEDAQAMAKAGADVIVCHLGLTAGGTIGAHTGRKLEDCPKLVDEWAGAALEVNPEAIILVHGGPVAEPQDAEFILRSTKDRAERERESEQAQIVAREEVEKSRLLQERSLAEARIQHQKEMEHREILRRRSIEEAEIRSREQTEREQIALELSLEKARIERDRERSEVEVQRRRALEVAEITSQIAVAVKTAELTQAEADRRRAEIAAAQDVETAQIAQERALDSARLERERQLDALNVAKRQAFEEAEISSGEEIERARIATERGLTEARVIRDGDIRRLELQRDREVDIAVIESAIAIANKTAERSVAIAAAEGARARAIAAEEQAITTREREIAERRKTTDLIAAAREADREALRLTRKAEAEKEAATSLAEAARISASGEAEAEKIKAQGAAARYEVEAKGAMQVNEAENMLSGPARLSRFRSKLLERIEGIVRESVRPMEKIDAIKILHIDGANGGGQGNRNVTDEVIDSALRYRVQAPMIDSLMKEIGIEGGGLGRMTEVLRDAKDIASLTAKRAAGDKDSQRSSDDDERR